LTATNADRSPGGAADGGIKPGFHRS